MDSTSTAADPTRMAAPPSGARIRMYRQGHGDCFLLAFRDDDGEPFYLLIDCGKKKGSEIHVSMHQVAENIRDATGGHLHLVVITHEHEDHVSGFLSEKEVFEGLQIDRLWLAWTEDPDNELAKALRVKYKDVLLGLVRAAEQLRGAAEQLRGATESSDNKRVREILKSLLEFELSDEDRALAVTEPDKIKGKTNKKSIQVVQQRAALHQGTEYLVPHAKPQNLPKVEGLRVFVLGPPQNEAKLKDLDPRSEEEFHLDAPEQLPFLAATGGSAEDKEIHQPFEVPHRIRVEDAKHHEYAEFFEKHYGLLKSYLRDDERPWRNIDGDWLRVGEQLALRINTYVNNTSLVLAFELPRSKKVLLFTGDAQRGNWLSWADEKWTIEGEEITSKDLLNRTTFYKVGHHGSHNATLNQGGLKDMAQGEQAETFTAMIPANESWALTANTPPWRHPLPAILEALRHKTQGRVLVMDRPPEPPPPSLLSPAGWQKFLGRTELKELYYELLVEDSSLPIDRNPTRVD